MLPPLFEITQFMKWCRFSVDACAAILPHVPKKFKTYYEPFLGAGAMLGMLGANENAVVGDINEPLMMIWHLLQEAPDELHSDYARQFRLSTQDPYQYFNTVKERYNKNKSPYDLLFLCNACTLQVHNVAFGTDGSFQNGILGDKAFQKSWTVREAVETFARRCDGIRIHTGDYRGTLSTAKKGDFVYLDPPKAIESLYFDYSAFFDELDRLNSVGVQFACTFDGRMPKLTQTVRLPYEELKLSMHALTRTNIRKRGALTIEQAQKAKASTVINYLYTNYDIAVK